MNIHSIYALLFKFWRQKRMAQFESIIRPSRDEVVLDVGGYLGTWTPRPQMPKRVDCLNLHAVAWDNTQHPEHRISTIVGDGCALPQGDDSYDIVFSNSVIEHVGGWQKQKAFAEEVRRVGKRSLPRHILTKQSPTLACLAKDRLTNSFPIVS